MPVLHSTINSAKQILLKQSEVSEVSFRKVSERSERRNIEGPFPEDRVTHEHLTNSLHTYSEKFMLDFKAMTGYTQTHNEKSVGVACGNFERNT